jgi:hypothetical protein
MYKQEHKDMGEHYIHTREVYFHSKSTSVSIFQETYSKHVYLTEISLSALILNAFPYIYTTKSFTGNLYNLMLESIPSGKS